MIARTVLFGVGGLNVLTIAPVELFTSTIFLWVVLPPTVENPPPRYTFDPEGRIA